MAGLGRSRRGRLALLLGIMLLGAGVRLNPLHEWLSDPEQYFFQGEPLERSIDGYRTLAHARDLLRGTYDELDERRQVPEYPARPWPPMLMAVLAVVIHKVTGVSLQWIAGVLPVMLGPLIAIPLYALGRYFAGTAMGLTAALVGVVAPAYVARSGFAWFDTDVLNVTFLLGTVYFALRFGKTDGMRRYRWLAGYVLVTAGFCWWWWPIRNLTFLMSLVPLGLALLLHYRTSRAEALAFLALLAGGVITALIVLGQDPARLADLVSLFWLYITEAGGGSLPNVASVNAEQIQVPLEVAATWTIGGLTGFIIGALGVVWLHWARFSSALYLAVLTAVGAFGIFFAVRFLIFTAALLSIGIGYLTARIWGLRTRHPWAGAAALLMLPLVLWPALVEVDQGPPKVAQSPALVGAMVRARANLPPDAVIWANWGHGNAVLYWADRGTIADGDYHDAERMIAVELPFTLEYDRHAANYMRFVAARGMRGLATWMLEHGADRKRAMAVLDELLSAGPIEARRLLEERAPSAVGEWRAPEDWARFLFPAQSRPVYLLLDDVFLRAFASLWSTATWDQRAAEGRVPLYRPILGLKIDVGTDEDWKAAVRVASARSSGAKLDPDLGVLTWSGGRALLDQLILFTGRRIHIERYNRPKDGYRFEANTRTGMGALMDERVAASLFNSLFLRQMPSSYFTPIDLDSPRYQLWEVHPDPVP